MTELEPTLDQIEDSLSDEQRERLTAFLAEYAAVKDAVQNARARLHTGDTLHCGYCGDELSLEHPEGPIMAVAIHLAGCQPFISRMQGT